MQTFRQDHELPKAIENWGWKYHHIGIPTDKRFTDEQYVSHLKFYTAGFKTSPFGVEWMGFEDESPVHYLVQTLPHVAFEVADLDYELTHRNLNVITEPNLPSEGVRVAMIEHNGAPIELIEFTEKHE